MIGGQYIEAGSMQPNVKVDLRLGALDVLRKMEMTSERLEFAPDGDPSDIGLAALNEPKYAVSEEV
jgi:hypothetical protein